MSNFLAAAKATSKPPLPHQMAAWHFAWDQLGEKQQSEFLVLFRSDPPQKPTLIWEPAAKLIREFEGFSEAAYICPAGVVTIGWGFTKWKDRPVQLGETISREVADGMLSDLIENKIVPALASTVPGWKTSLLPAQQNALVSFAYNVGWHFCGSADFVKISRCLRESDYDAVPSAMMLYINPGTSAEPGLRRRRQAEGKLWGISKKATSVLLKVNWENQNDNASGTGYRECFSSSCAMIAKFYGKVKSDDEYNAIRAKYGDTTDSQSQLSTLRSLGLQARFVTNAAPGLLELELKSGRAVAVGWLHQGPVQAPSGGGHWSVVIGFDQNYWIHNDPNGEADLLAGGYTTNQNGAGVRYSRKNWDRRWLIDGASTGWCVLVKP